MCSANPDVLYAIILYVLLLYYLFPLLPLQNNKMYSFTKKKKEACITCLDHEVVVKVHSWVETFARSVIQYSVLLEWEEKREREKNKTIPEIRIGRPFEGPGIFQARFPPRPFESEHVWITRVLRLIKVVSKLDWFVIYIK